MTDNDTHALAAPEVHPVQRLTVPSWEQAEPLVDEFVRMRDYAPSTAYQTRYTVRRFLEWALENGTANPMEFRQQMVERGVKRAYIASQFSTLRTFWEYLMLKGLAEHNPFRVVTVRRDRVPRIEALTEEEVRRLLEAARDADARPRALVNLLLRTGIRLQAARLANVEDVDTSTDPPRLWVQHKGHRERDLWVLLYPGAMRPLNEWLRQRPESRDKALFVSRYHPNARLCYHSLYRDVNRVFLAAQIFHKPPHSLRHTAVTLARKHGATLDGVREMAGHTDPKTTLHYDHSIQRWQNPAEKVLEEVLKEEPG